MLARVIAPLRVCARTLRLPSNPIYHLHRQWMSNMGDGKNPTQDFKDQSKHFYETQVQPIVELKAVEDWQNIIVGAKEPIIVDLYAEWCDPCKKLAPRLEKRVREAGNVKLVKVDIDKFPQIAQALQVKSVPTVYLIYGNQAVDGFQGAIDDQGLDRFFQSISRISNISSGEKQAMEALDRAREKIGSGNKEEAIQILEAMNEKGVNKDMIAVKEIFLAQCYLSLEKFSKFKQVMMKVQKYQDFYHQNPDMKKFYQMMMESLEKIKNISQEHPEIRQAKQKISQNGPKLEHRFELVEAYRKNELIQEALEEAIEIIKQDKNWEEKKANKLVLAIFKQLGNSSPITQKYRKIFQRILN